MREMLASLVDHLLEKGFFLEQAVEILERTMIAQVLEQSGGNQTAASKVLGIHRNTLQRKMVEYQMDGRRPRRKPPGRAHAARKRATARKRA